jgi:hypothetical protein
MKLSGKSKYDRINEIDEEIQSLQFRIKMCMKFDMVSEANGFQKKLDKLNNELLKLKGVVKRDN